jgi:ferredoxin
MVSDFLSKAQLSNQGNTYLFAVTTCFGIAGNTIPQANTLLNEKGCYLNYGAKIKMFGNSVTNYNMNSKVDEITKESDQRAVSVIRDIVNKEISRISPINQLLYWAYLKFIREVPTIDEKFFVNDDCITCGICKSVCPAKNITLVDGKTIFHHQCERCLACIQHCPKRAINYRDKTQKRRRYTHPQVGYKKIIKYYKDAD